MVGNEEDWFYDSILRYKTLNMFELEYPIHLLELTTCNSICIACSNKEKNQILELALPMKLTAEANGCSETIITNDTDLKIKCGKFINTRIAHMKTQSSNLKVLASHDNNKNITLYALSSNNTDEITKESVLKCELEGASLDLKNTELVLAKDNTSSKFLMDITTGKMTKEISSEESDYVESVTPIYVGPMLIALCHNTSGKVQFYDTRASKVINELKGSTEKHSNCWAFTSSYSSSENSTKSLIGMVSNQGCLKLYDSRNLQVPSVNVDLGIKTLNTSVQLKLKPSNDCSVSVSGFDGNVYVYQLLSEPELVFAHDGHRHVEGFNSQTTTTSHLWFPHIDNLVISSASNGTIQSWQFEDQRNCNKS